MIFLIIAIAAIILYVWDYKIPAMLFFFFFITAGYDLFSEDEMTHLGFITKGVDFAFFIQMGIITIACFTQKKYFRIDKFTLCLSIFGSFLVICILNSKFLIGLSWAEILRSVRYQFFWLVYFIFRSMEKEQLERLLRYLFIITVVLSVLYLLQIVLDKRILSGMEAYRIDVFGVRLPRFYNQPKMLHFFTVMAIFCNPYQGKWKWISTIILVLAFLGAFHRNLYGILTLILIFGYSFKLSRLNRTYFLLRLGIILISILTIAGTQFMKSRTFTDLQFVKDGDFAEVEDMDIEMEDFYKSTFTFRLAHLVERNQYLLEHPKAMLLGAGLLTDDSNNLDRLFDFKIGLLADATGEVVQIGTADISYSPLLIKFGYLGTALYVALFIYLSVFFYKNKKKHPYAVFSFLFCILLFGTSFFSISLLMPVNYLLLLMSYVIIQKSKEQYE
ncbi:MAG: hypothetical protein LBS25_03550 [Candidatus Symbiothrix sp.]|jgi:hypothetical protein|nr:hypothetical protein [Candidatus Symbiothrix sp.]